jgi:hypothetical protein
MFVLSLKASTLKLTGLLAALGIVVAAAFWEGGIAGTATDVLTQAASSQSVSSTGVANSADLSTNEKRVAFLKGLGWQVGNEPIEVAEITIPQTFNTVYNNYNNIQKAQGYDLSQYRGVRAKRWTYNITNYPGEKEGVRANLLIYNDKLIGGDVSSVAINGFMQGLGTKNVKTGVEPSQADIVAETYKTYNLN